MSKTPADPIEQSCETTPTWPWETNATYNATTAWTAHDDAKPIKKKNRKPFWRHFEKRK